LQIRHDLIGNIQEQLQAIDFVRTHFVSDLALANIPVDTAAGHSLVGKA
jgi:hypothetical protein